MGVIQIYGLYLLCLMFGQVLSLSDSIAVANSSGTHCGNFTPTKDSNDMNSNEADHFRCVDCLYAHNCLSDNICRLGTTGSTCERCFRDSEMKGYHRLGSVCIPCPSIPSSAVSFGVYFLILTATMFYHGLSGSLATKLKLLCHFLQCILLTFHIKLAWPASLTEFFDFVNFGSFNSNIMLPECLFSKWPALSIHYLEWLTSLCIPIAVILFGKFLDSSMKKISSMQSSKHEDEDNLSRSHSKSKRTAVRRLVIMVIVMMYMPSILSCIRTYLCTENIPVFLVLDQTENTFLLDNSELCTSFLFQTIHFVGTVYLIGIGVGFPLLLVLFTLRQKKWDLLYSQWTLYSPLYESYKDRYCFWEAIPMLRKLICLVVTETYPVSPFLQCVVQLGTSVLYLLAVIVLRPYRACHLGSREINIHTSFEVVSTLVVCLIQMIGLSTILHLYDASYEIAGKIAICVVIVFWLVIYIAMACESTPEIVLTDIEEPSVPTSSIESQKSEKKVRKSRRNNKIGQDPAFTERVNKNKTRVDF